MAAIVGALRVVLGIDTAAFEKGLSQAERTLSRVGSQLQSIGAKMSVAITAPLAAIGGAALKVSADFEKAMSNVSTLVDTASESVQGMSKEVLDLARRTPVPLADLSGALYDIRSAGIAAGDAMAVLEGSAKLAVAGLGTTKEAADLVTSSINAFGLKGEDAARVYDVIFKTVQAGKTTISDLAQGFGAVAGTVASAGIRLDEYLASVAAMTTAGIPAAQAHTQIRAVIAGLTRETKETTAVFDHLGAKSFKDLIAKSGGLVPALTRIKDALGGNEERIQKLLGSTEALNAVISLTGNQANTFRAALDNMRNGADAVGTAFNKQAETMAAKTQILSNNLQALGVDLGTALLPALKQITAAVQGAVEWFSGLDDNVKKVVVVIGGLAAVIGPVIIVLGTLAGAIAAIGIPAATVVGAITAITAGIAALSLRSEEAANAIETRVIPQLGNMGVAFDRANAKIKTGTDQAKEWFSAIQAMGTLPEVFGPDKSLMMPPLTGPMGTGETDEQKRKRENAERRIRNQLESQHNALMAEGIRLTTEVQTPMEALAAKMAKLNELQAVGAINATTYGRQMQMAAATAHNAFAGALSGISGALAQAFEANKGFAVANAIINSYQAFTAALRNPPGPPFSYAQAAAALASGFAQVRAIMSTTKNSRGGGGGASAPSGGGEAAGPAQQPQMVTLNLAPGRYSREEVLGMMEQIEDQVNNGAQFLVKRG